MLIDSNEVDECILTYMDKEEIMQVIFFENLERRKIMKISIKRGVYRKKTGRREPNARRLKKMLKAAGVYAMMEAYLESLTDKNSQNRHYA